MPKLNKIKEKYKGKKWNIHNLASYLSIHPLYPYTSHYKSWPILIQLLIDILSINFFPGNIWLHLHMAISC